MRVRKTKSLLGLSLLMLVVGGMSVAWACTTQASLQLTPRSGPAGIFVTAEGDNWRHSGESVGNTTSYGPVEIRWNSADGQKVGEGSAPSFAVSIQIPPDASPGVHYVVAIQNSVDAAGTSRVVAQASQAFTVRGENAPPQGQPAQGSRSEDVSANLSAGEPSAQPGSAPDPRRRLPGGLREEPADSGLDGDESLGTGAATALTNGGGPDGPDALTTSNSQAQGGSTARPGSAGRQTSASVGSRNAVPVETISSDLWSGFGSERSSLGQLAPEQTQSNGGGNRVALLAGLTAVGISALVGGFAAGEARRRRLADAN